MVKKPRANVEDARDRASIPDWKDHLEEEMATCSCILGWKTPWIQEPGGLQCMVSQRVRHD